MKVSDPAFPVVSEKVGPEGVARGGATGVGVVGVTGVGVTGVGITGLGVVDPQEGTAVSTNGVPAKLPVV